MTKFAHRNVNMALDLTLSPLYRINGQEIANMPGLLAQAPSRGAARGREADRFVAYVLLTGNSTVTSGEYMQVAELAANVFYASTGSITNALRAASDAVNKSLLDRNMNTTSRGQYAIGWLTLAALRDSQCTLLLSGPMHVYHFSAQGMRHVYEPSVSGKGLGMSQAAGIHFAQLELQTGDYSLLCGKLPSAWESPLNDPTPSSLDALRRRLTLISADDLNAVFIKASQGNGTVTLLSSAAEIKEDVPAAAPVRVTPQARPEPAGEVDSARTSGTAQRAETVSTPEPARRAHMLQPSAYAIAPPKDDAESATPRGFPSSIPRASASAQPFITNDPLAQPQPADVAASAAPAHRSARERVRSLQPAAHLLAQVIQFSRRVSQSAGEKFQAFLPRLLPNSESVPSNTLMMFMAILVPLIVVTIASVVYLRYGRSLQYETYLAQAQQLRAEAVTLTDPVEQRKAWENVLLNVDIAESHRKTDETTQLRNEAVSNLDALLGITRLQFTPAFSNDLGIDISRLAASETDLFMLNAADGEVLHAQLTNGRDFQMDTSFLCQPGVYGNYTVGPLVDILAMPTLNSINATLLGVDATGNLLYCAPGQVAQAIPLPAPATNWGRVTAFVLDANNLYVLDAPARAVWVYNGKDGTFIDQPYFFFGGQTPEKQDVIDLAVTGDDLYMLHADGHLSTCSYSRIESVPTRCQDPAPLVNPFAAYQDTDLFGSAHFTQMLFNAPPDQSILLLDADSQAVMRFAPRTLELQNQFRPTTDSSNPIPSGSAGAITVGPNHIMYLAVSGQVYFAAMP